MKLFYLVFVFVASILAINVASCQADKSPATPSTGVLTGHVVYPDGKPAGGIRVAAVMERPFIWELTQKGFLKRTPKGSFTKEAVDFLTAQTNISAITQADGSFRLQGLTTAPYDLLVTGKPENTAWDAPSDWIADAAVGVWGKQGQTVRRSQNIVLTRGVEIHGKVIDTNGKPLTGIRVGSVGPHRPESSGRAASALTDEKGEYSMRVPPGEITVYLAGPSTIYSKLEGELRITLNGKAINGDMNFKDQIKFPVSTEKSDIVNYQFLSKGSS